MDYLLCRSWRPLESVNSRMERIVDQERIERMRSKMQAARAEMQEKNNGA